MTNLIFIILMLTSQVEIQSISYGNGGGFTGAVNAFVLNSNGDLFSENVFTEEKTFITTVDSSKVANVFQSAHQADLLNIELNKPGNMYKFINFNLNGNHHKIIWSGKSENKSLNLLYAELMKLHTTNE